jgi:pimeloyl-ACP methyl ester carboxylesterase
MAGEVADQSDRKGQEHMMAKRALFCGGCALALFSTACASDDESSSGAPTTPGNLPAGCGAMVNEADCDRSKRPIVVVHGTVGSGDNYAHPMELFASNGYCSDMIRAVDYNSVGSRPDAELDALIEELRDAYGHEKVDLMGHSQGAGHGARYSGANPDKIANYVNCAGTQLASDPGGVRTLCLSSTGDRPVTCGTSANVTFQDETLDHFAVASSTESFVEMYKFLNDGEEPQYREVQCGDPIMLRGRAITFPDSQYVVGGTIDVYEIGDSPRDRGTPFKRFEIGADGYIPEFQARRGVAYEFKMIPPPGDTRVVRNTYMPQFKRSDRLIRFLYRTANEGLATTNNSVDFNDAHAVVIARHKKGGFHFGEDSLKIDGFEAINAENAPLANSTVVGMYMFDEAVDTADGPGNGVSDGGSIITGPFINSSDVFIPSDRPKFVEVNYNGQALKVPNWPSATQGMSLLLFPGAD